MAVIGRFALAARTLRGSETELWHYAAAAVMTPDGRLVASVGDPELPAFTRSTVKPFQVLPLLLAGGVERFELDERDLALICSSHAGAPAHTAGVESLLERGGFGTEDLVCAAHPPFDRRWAEALLKSGEAPSALHNNCSGKHAGMLLGCRLLELDPAGYSAVDHPYERQVRTEISAVTGQPREKFAAAIDGCGLPTPRLPLAGLALAYARLADPAAGGMDPERASALERVAASMAAAPEMVAGEGRFTTRLMQVTGGRLIGKEGADGLYAVAVRGPVALGVALRLAAGEEKPRDTVVLDLLRQVGSLAATELDELDPFFEPAVRNHAGLEVGAIRSEVELIEERTPRRLEAAED